MVWTREALQSTVLSTRQEQGQGQGTTMPTIPMDTLIKCKLRVLHSFSYNKAMLNPPFAHAIPPPSFLQIRNFAATFHEILYQNDTNTRVLI